MVPSLVNVLHHLELTPARVDLGDAARGQLVHQATQHLQEHSVA